MSTDNEQAPDSLKRDQLINALDNEIGDTLAIQASTGRTRWGVLLTLAALTGLGIQTWESGKFSPYRTTALALATITAWDVLHIILKALDNLPLTGRPGPARFFRLSELLGSFRSTQALYIGRAALLLTATLWLAAPVLKVTKWFYLVETLALSIGFLASFSERFLGAESSAAKYPITIVAVLNLAFHVAAAVGAVVLVFKTWAAILPADVRAALIMTAILYLICWLGDENVPIGLLNRLRELRQNLAFCRIPMEEARKQADLLLIGAASHQVFARPFEEVSQAIQQVWPALEPIHAVTQKYNSQAAPLREIPAENRSAAEREEFAKRFPS